jgi:hypothetical protein
MSAIRALLDEFINCKQYARGRSVLVSGSSFTDLFVKRQFVGLSGGRVCTKDLYSYPRRRAEDVSARLTRVLTLRHSHFVLYQPHDRLVSKAELSKNFVATLLQRVTYFNGM